MNPDVIEKTVDIDAPISAVWTLVSEPGWYINAGTVVPHVLEDRGDGVTAVIDPDVGTWLLRTIELREPQYASFRWFPSAGQEYPEGATSLVEFTLEQIGNGAPPRTRLTVRESGLASLSADELESRRHYEENSEGWDEELAAAKAYCERPRSGQ